MRRILTPKEMDSLVQWCLDAATVIQPKDRQQIRLQIRKYLLLRRRQTTRMIKNKKNPMYRKKAIPLSAAAHSCLASNGPTNQWFREQFYGKHPEISEKAECTDNAIRMAATSTKKARHHLETALLEAANLPVPHTVKVPKGEVKAFVEELQLNDGNVLRGGPNPVNRCCVTGCKPRGVADKMLNADVAKWKGNLQLRGTLGTLPAGTEMHWLACIGDIMIFKQEDVQTAYTALEEHEGNEVLITLNSRNLAEKAIFNPITGEFQSGDVKFMARVKEEVNKLQHLREENSKALALARQIPGHTDTLSFQDQLATRKGEIEKQASLVKRIKNEDARRGRARMFNHDECPQMICFGGGTGTTRRRVAGQSGKQAKSSQVPNRECVTVHPIANLNGTFGPWHLIFSGESLTDSMISEAFLEMPEGLITHTAKGVQTGHSLLQFYKKFYEWSQETQDTIKHEFGEWQIQTPILLLTDGHSSRYNQEVLDYCATGDKLRQVLEPAQTSDKLQMLDQIFASFHHHYICGVREIRKIRGDTYQT